jgi:DNA-binding transcriptional LysR family regulator
MKSLPQLRTDDLLLFARVAELGSLSAAAREIDVPVSQVTRSLNRLEVQCGSRLLHRTTHGLSLTDEGDIFLNYCRSAKESLNELSAELDGKLSGPSGWVRISVSGLVAQSLIVPSLAGLYALHPALRIDINVDDRAADLSRDGIDIAIRSGAQHSDTVVAKHLGYFARRLYAAPSYLARAGTPSAVSDLAQHHLISNRSQPLASRWPVAKVGSGKKNSWSADKANMQTQTDHSALLLSLTLGGLGIAQIMDVAAAPYVASGQLVQVLEGQFEAPKVSIVAVMLQERHRLPKIRACIDYWADWVTTQTMAIA